MHHLALILVLAFTIGSSHAAERGKPEVRFLAERAPETLGPIVMVAGESRSEPFDLPINSLSPPIEAPARTFGLRPESKELALASVTLPESGSSFIVILIPSPTQGFTPVVLASDDPKFRPGDVCFYNHSDKTVLGYVGSAKFTLGPAKSTILRPTGARPEKFYDVGFGVREKEGARALSTTRWPVEDTIRSYVFFFINPKTKRIDFRAVDEFVPPAT